MDFLKSDHFHAELENNSAHQMKAFIKMRKLECVKMGRSQQGVRLKMWERERLPLEARCLRRFNLMGSRHLRSGEVIFS